MVRIKAGCQLSRRTLTGDKSFISGKQSFEIRVSPRQPHIRVSAPRADWNRERPMNRVPLLLFATVFAVIGVLAASSVYLSEKNEATMKAPGIEPAPATWHR